MSRKFTAVYSTIALYGNIPDTKVNISDNQAVQKSMGHNEPEEIMNVPEHRSYWVKDDTDIKMPDKDRKKNPFRSISATRADELKQQYNKVLKQYNEIEDGSYEITCDPVYKEVNWLLRVLAQSIANVLENKPEDSIMSIAEIQELLIERKKLVTVF